jgi:hypothetical protein
MADTALVYQTNPANLTWGCRIVIATLRFAATEAERPAIYCLRDDICVEEIGYVFPDVDHRGPRHRPL